METLIENWIKDWFITKSPEIDLGSDQNFFEEGAVDSFGVMELITDLEEHFKITFSQEEFQDKRFTSISGLSEIIRQKID
tara:strand:- start:4081 stop:4320 length:240 start_codon:yes stop_codon:yes gene_type:complete